MKYWRVRNFHPLAGSWGGGQRGKQSIKQTSFFPFAVKNYRKRAVKGPLKDEHEPAKCVCVYEGETEEKGKEEGTNQDSSEVHFNLHGSGRQEFSISSLSFSISLILSTPFSMLARPGPESERHTK